MDLASMQTPPPPFSLCPFILHNGTSSVSPSDFACRPAAYPPLPPLPYRPLFRSARRAWPPC